MDFIKYHSIDNSSRKKLIDYIIAENLDKGEFVVQEKTHGANLSFWYDGLEFKSAKRTSFIDDDFYDYKKVEDKYRARVIKLYETLNNNDNKCSQLTIYGELIGGSYPHKDVEKDKSSTRIQKGIHYSPENDFYAIDISIDGLLIDIDRFNSIMNEAGFLYAQTIFRGTFQECLSYPNKFITKIPLWLGLPEIEDNFCEGVVIKSVIPTFLSNRDRLILKNKNEKWAEKAKVKNRKAKPKPSLSQSAMIIYAQMAQYITKNRLNNVLSKMGTVKQTDFGNLMREYCQDILSDFNKEHGEEFNKLEKKERKQLTRNLNNDCSKYIRANFQNIIDQTF